MQGAAALEDFEVGEDIPDVSPYSVKPSLFLETFIRASVCDSRFHIFGSLQSLCVRNFCQGQIISNRSFPHPASRSREHPSPPKLARARLADDLFPIRQNMFLPDAEQSRFRVILGALDICRSCGSPPF